MWTAAVYSGSLAGVEHSATTSAPERRRNSSCVIAGAAVVNPRIAITSSRHASVVRRAMSTSVARANFRDRYNRRDVEVAMGLWSYVAPRSRALPWDQRLIVDGRDGP